MKFYVVEHPDGFSVQDNPKGAGILIGNYSSLEIAQAVCDAANKVIKIITK